MAFNLEETKFHEFLSKLPNVETIELDEIREYENLGLQDVTFGGKSGTAFELNPAVKLSQGSKVKKLPLKAQGEVVYRVAFSIGQISRDNTEELRAAYYYEKSRFLRFLASIFPEGTKIKYYNKYPSGDYLRPMQTVSAYEMRLYVTEIE